MIEKNHPPIKYGNTGVLIVNLGTPDSTSWWDIRKYLREFLSDRRVIELNPIIWQIILNLFILTFRPSKTAHAYKKIWRKKRRFYQPIRSNNFSNIIYLYYILGDVAQRLERALHKR